MKLYAYVLVLITICRLYLWLICYCYTICGYLRPEEGWANEPQFRDPDPDTAASVSQGYFASDSNVLAVRSAPNSQETDKDDEEAQQREE